MLTGLTALLAQNSQSYGLGLVPGVFPVATGVGGKKKKKNIPCDL